MASRKDVASLAEERKREPPGKGDKDEKYCQHAAPVIVEGPSLPRRRRPIRGLPRPNALGFRSLPREAR